MEEKVFFDNNGVKVTNARFVVDDQTYAMASVNSVKVSSINVTQSTLLPALLMFVGFSWLSVVFIAPSSDATRFVLPAMLLIGGWLWLRSIREILEYKIILTTSSGETSALRSTNRDDIYSVEKALHDAIIFRG